MPLEAVYQRYALRPLLRTCIAPDSRKAFVECLCDAWFTTAQQDSAVESCRVLKVLEAASCVLDWSPISMSLLEKQTWVIRRFATGMHMRALRWCV